MRSNYVGAGEDHPLDTNPNQDTNPDNIMEIRYHVDNTKNSLKVSEVLVQLL
jgi:hypothetical protein